MVLQYQIDRLITELSDIQRYVHWGMTCNGVRVDHFYSKEIAVDSDALRGFNEVISSKYGSCLELGLLMQHIAKKHGVPCKQCISSHETEWAFHGFIVIDNIAISMGNYFYVLDYKMMLPFVEVPYSVGESRQSVYEKFRRIVTT